MKEKLTFDKGFWKSFSWFLLLVIVICCLPWLLAKHTWIDFSSTGEIGDTIGGIMGPYVAIAAAGLTFIAFDMLYYNGFSHPKFKDLIERYAILNNIRHTWLASFKDRELIKEKVQNGYLSSQDEGRDMTREYKKGAFVYDV